LAQAKAQLKVAQAALDLAEVTYKRYQDLFNCKVISAQDFDTAADNYGGNQATVIADQANVDRLEALEAFKIIRAPSDGMSLRGIPISERMSPLARELNFFGWQRLRVFAYTLRSHKLFLR
jgi:multidrug efflux pump subunit AcrA (membrane-fusion protein)